MLPQINNKTLLECTEDDFAEILNNPDYRENQYLDYKRTFSFLEADKNTPWCQAVRPEGRFT